MKSLTFDPPAPEARPNAARPRDRARGASVWIEAWAAAIRASLVLIAFSVFMLSALWVAIVYQVHRETADAIRNAEVGLTNLTRAFAEHTSRTLEGADQAIRFVRNEYADHGASLDIADYLKRKAIIDSTFHLISIVGPDGYVSNSSQAFQRIDLRDREHFRFHAEGNGTDQLFISKPVLGRVSKKWSIQLTRRIDPPDGHGFGGVVVLSLSPEYLTRFYSDVDLGRHGAITLVGYDGFVRARATREGTQGAQDLSANPIFLEAMRRKSGTLIATSRIDRVERLWAFRALDDYGLLVFTGMGSDDVLAEAADRRSSYLLGASLMTVVIIGFVGGLVRRAKLQHDLMRQLEESNKQAQAANQMKTRFLASVSHELRTPLNGIIGFAEMLKDAAADAESREFGQIIHQSAKHLHGLVNTILDLAKIESGRMQLQLGSVDVAKLLDEVRALNAVHAQTRGLEFRSSILPTAPGCITTDAARLTQVLNNLIHNAVKFTDTGGVSVVANGTASHLVIEVSDTGVGIAPDLLGSIFTRFHATATDFVHPAQGAGLGLPLAHELVELLGGSIEIASTSPEGTTVFVRLPVAGPATHHQVDPHA